MVGKEVSVVNWETKHTSQRGVSNIVISNGYHLWIQHPPKLYHVGQEMVPIPVQFTPHLVPELFVVYENGLYFCSNDNHLYVTSLDVPQEPRKIAAIGGDVNIILNVGCFIITQTCSTFAHAYYIDVIKIKNQRCVSHQIIKCRRQFFPLSTVLFDSLYNEVFDPSAMRFYSFPHLPFRIDSFIPVIDDMAIITKENKMMLVCCRSRRILWHREMDASYQFASCNDGRVVRYCAKGEDQIQIKDILW